MRRLCLHYLSIVKNVSDSEREIYNLMHIDLNFFRQDTKEDVFVHQVRALAFYR